MKPVRFTQHALGKLELMLKWGFKIDRDEIARSLIDPHESSIGYRGRVGAHLELDEDHILRVVYEENSEVVVVPYIQHGGIDMKIKYSREVDILTIQVSDVAADHAEESDGVITHFSAVGIPVMFEIQGGREFLLSSITSLVNEEEVSLL